MVDQDAYLLHVGRYIHRNPAEVKGALPDVLETYPWSSYRTYISLSKAPAWLTRDRTYQMLGHRQRYAGYRAYVEAGNGESIEQFYSKGNVAAIIGDQDFRELLAAKAEEFWVSGDLSQVLSERPSAREVVGAVGFRKGSIETGVGKGGKGFEYYKIGLTRMA